VSVPQNYSSIHIIGLGGTGANVIQTIIESERLSQKLSSEDFSMACLAIDVADGDLASLMQSYKNVSESLRAKGVPLNRLSVRAVNIKFTTPDSLFEFLERFNSYLYKDGIVAEAYRPWISSSLSIPPLAGGVGRMRALSKAVYNLNYYHYSELANALSVFKDNVLSSKFQPIVMIVFGLGGGTGGGLVFDLARHLRMKLGSAIPIIGLAVLPTNADDLLARGPAPYMALNEASFLFDRSLNDRIAKRFGQAYMNPFNAFFFLPLDPVYNHRNSLLAAKRELDAIIVDMINVLMSFDLADMLSMVGTNNDFGPNWVHTLGYLKIRYPVEGYINYFKEYLRWTESIGAFIAVKNLELKTICELIRRREDEAKDLLRKHLISTGSYSEETFEVQVNDIVRRGGKYDAEMRRQLRGVSQFMSYYVGKYEPVLKSMKFSEDSTEYGVVSRLISWMEKLTQLEQSHEELSRNLQGTLKDLEESLSAAKLFTTSHIRQVRSMMNLLSLAGAAVDIVSAYIRAKTLSDEVAVRFGRERSEEGKRAASISEVELTPLFKVAGYMLMQPETEIKLWDQYLPEVRIIKKRVEEEFNTISSKLEAAEKLLAESEMDKERLEREAKKIRIDLSGRRRRIMENVKEVDAKISSLKTELEYLKGEREVSQKELKDVSDLEKGLEIASEYRRLLSSIVARADELNSTLSRMTTTTSYYERVVELSEVEQLKIMERILGEQEDSLKSENVLREILDRDRFKNIVKSYLRVFSIPSYAGLSSDYRTDLIWVTVGIPQGLWDQELQETLRGMLNVYSTVEASKSIVIKQIPQIDPWVITFLVVFAKARIDQIENFPSMKSESESVRRGEKVMFRSFLLEQGYHTEEELRALAQKLTSP
jgi:hypothetical protein